TAAWSGTETVSDFFPFFFSVFERALRTAKSHPGQPRTSSSSVMLPPADVAATPAAKRSVTVGAFLAMAIAASSAALAWKVQTFLVAHKPHDSQKGRAAPQSPALRPMRMMLRASIPQAIETFQGSM